MSLNTKSQKGYTLLRSATDQTQKAEEFFTWTPEEAGCKACRQSAASNCGATALQNALLALGVPLPDPKVVDAAVHTNSRKHGVGVAEYLAARSVAGCTGEDIVEGCRAVAGNLVESRFFPFYPRRDVDLQRWLSGWLSMGCSAVATLNMQAISDEDYWHHQMVFGVDARGVHMTNGVECLSFDEIRSGLASPSVLKVYLEDALSCSPFDAEKCDSLGSDWAELRVSQQLERAQRGRCKEEYVYIPAAYNAGISIFAPKGTPAASLLLSTPELPLHHGTGKATFGETLASLPLSVVQFPGEIGYQVWDTIDVSWRKFVKKHKQMEAQICEFISL